MKKIIDFFSKHKYEILLWLFILTYAACFSFLSIRRFQTLNSHYYDLGIMNQVVYNTSKGRFLEMTNQDLIKNTSRLAIHFDPILALFAPFYKIYSGPEILLIGQNIILGLGTLAVFLISKKILNKELISLVFSLLYLLYFPIQRVSLFDFHAVALSTSFFLFALYFNLIKKNGLYFLFIILSLLTKEHVGLVIFFLGIYLFFIKKQKKTGIITAFLGLAFFVSTVYFIIPYFRNESHFALRYFEDFGDSPSSILINFFRHPFVVIRAVFRPEIFNYLIRMILPLFYAVFSPLSFLIALPEWAINILSINENMRSIFFHYNSIIVPFLFYSLILGYKNFSSIVKNKNWQIIIFAIFILLNIKSIYQYNPVPYFVKHPVSYKEIDSMKNNSIKIWHDNLKNENIKVSTTPKLAPFFTNRRYYYNFLYDSAFNETGLTEKDILKNEINKYVLADYVIINKSEIGDINKETLPVKFYQKLKDDNGFKMIYSDDRDKNSIEVYKKI